MNAARLFEKISFGVNLFNILPLCHTIIRSMSKNARD